MSDPEIKKVLLDLAEAWTQLADKIDAANKIAGDLLTGPVRLGQQLMFPLPYVRDRDAFVGGLVDVKPDPIGKGAIGGQDTARTSLSGTAQSGRN